MPGRKIWAGGLSGRKTGQPQLARFISGATDGIVTEVVQSAQLQEGCVITGVGTTQKTSTNQSGFSFPIPGAGGPPEEEGRFDGRNS